MPSNIIAGTPASPNCASVPVLQHDGISDRCGTWTGEDDGPPMLIIGSNAPAERIHQLAQRHRLETADLIRFARGGQS